MIQQDGIPVIFDCLKRMHRMENADLLVENAGTILAVLSQLIGFPQGVEWIEKHHGADFRFGTDVLDSVVPVMFNKFRPRSKKKSTANSSKEADELIAEEQKEKRRDSGKDQNPSRDVFYSDNTRRLAACFIASLCHIYKSELPYEFYRAMCKKPDLSNQNYYHLLCKLDESLHSTALIKCALFIMVMADQSVNGENARVLDLAVEAIKALPDDVASQRDLLRRQLKSRNKQEWVGDYLLQNLAMAFTDVERLELACG